MKIPWHWYVYVLECDDGLYYTGLTWNIALRLEQHLSGRGGAFTAEHGVKQVCWVEIFPDFSSARWREHEIKDWRRDKKERLWRGQEHRFAEYNKDLIALKEVFGSRVRSNKKEERLPPKPVAENQRSSSNPAGEKP